MAVYENERNVIPESIGLHHCDSFDGSVEEIPSIEDLRSSTKQQRSKEGVYDELDFVYNIDTRQPKKPTKFCSKTKKAIAGSTIVALVLGTILAAYLILFVFNQTTETTDTTKRATEQTTERTTEPQGKYVRLYTKRYSHTIC